MRISAIISKNMGFFSSKGKALWTKVELLMKMEAVLSGRKHKKGAMIASKDNFLERGCSFSM